MKIFVALPMLLFGASMCGARAAEYFVAIGGNNANDGLERGTAFATMQKGLDALNPGDVLTIAPGEYHEAILRAGLGNTNVDRRRRRLLLAAGPHIPSEDPEAGEAGPVGSCPSIQT